MRTFKISELTAEFSQCIPTDYEFSLCSSSILSTQSCQCAYEVIVMESDLYPKITPRLNNILFSAHDVPGIGLIESPPSLQFKWQKKLTLGKVLAKGHFINLLSGEIAQKLGRKPRYEDCHVVVVVHNTVLLPRIQCILLSLTCLKLMQYSSAKCMLCAENPDAHHGPRFLGVSTCPRVFHPYGYFWMYFLSVD